MSRPTWDKGESGFPFKLFAFAASNSGVTTLNLTPEASPPDAALHAHAPGVLEWIVAANALYLLALRPRHRWTRQQPVPPDLRY